MQPCVSTWDDRGSCYIYTTTLGRFWAGLRPKFGPGPLQTSPAREILIIYIYINRRELYKSGDQL